MTLFRGQRMSPDFEMLKMEDSQDDERHETILQSDSQV